MQIHKKYYKTSLKIEVMYLPFISFRLTLLNYNEPSKIETELTSTSKVDAPHSILSSKLILANNRSDTRKTAVDAGT